MAVVKRFFRWFARGALLIGGPIAIAVAGLYFYMSSGRYVTTENAYVKADLIIIAPEVTGRVVEVAIVNNQTVDPGQVLFRLDPARFEVERARLAADLASARQKVEMYKARHRTKVAELAAAETDVGFWTEELARARKLKRRGTISEFRVIEVRRAHQQAQTRVAVIHEQIAEALADLGGDADSSIDIHPQVQKALADLRRAELDLNSTIVRAPAAAITANLNLQVGEFVEEGDAVLSLVGTGRVWVVANLKETDLTHLKVGQGATLEVDAYPGRLFKAKVASLSPATGAEYALLPPQNASGNWVKVVQRVPVRLEITQSDADPALRAGMSVAVSIDTGYERPLPDVLTKARAWILDEPPE